MRHKKGSVQEDLETLQRLERHYRQRPQKLRILALRLLKEEPSQTLKEVASLLGVSYRTLLRWWSKYHHQGLDGLLDVGKGGGKKPIKIGKEGMEELKEKLQKDGFSDLKQIQTFLKERFGVHYSTSGVWHLVRIRLKAKPKTGRPKSVRQNPEEVEAFKKKGWKK